MMEMEMHLWELYDKGHMNNYIPIRINLKDVQDYSNIIQEYCSLFSDLDYGCSILRDLSQEFKFLILFDQYEAYD